ncbi:hypothetical protein [Yersinia kristensenii]|uniref:COG3904 family protein n=1 Tax=Yersinia TaxID=629 RepID=UPI0011A20A7A|nr:hypothetical protein [Yersinia kristensenii]HDL7986496.1 hypothetical protein [Yersinia enterocolitica]
MKNILFVILVILFSSSTYALEHINWDFKKDGSFCPLLGYKMCTMHVYTGDIVKGDANKLDGYISKLAKLEPSTRIGIIQISSNGGDVEEALRIGRILRKNQIQVLIPMDSHCYSSCVLLLAGGVGRFPVGDVGIHSFYSMSSQKPNADYEQEEKIYTATEKSIRDYLNEMRVSGAVMDAMLRVPSSKLEILDIDKLKEYGLFGIDPVFNQYLLSNNYINK